MTESIPLWEDWRFWQIVVTGALAFLGFTVGTWVKHYYDLRLDRMRRAADARTLAITLKAELTNARDDASSRDKLIGDLQKAEKPIPASQLVAFNLPSSTIFDNNTERLGLLGEALVEQVVGSYGYIEHIRLHVAAIRQLDASFAMPDKSVSTFKGDLGRLIRHVDAATVALEKFLQKSGAREISAK